MHMFAGSYQQFHQICMSSYGPEHPSVFAVPPVRLLEPTRHSASTNNRILYVIVATPIIACFISKFWLLGQKANCAVLR